MTTYIIKDKQGNQLPSLLCNPFTSHITSLKHAIEVANEAEKTHRVPVTIWRQKENGGYVRVIYK